VVDSSEKEKVRGGKKGGEAREADFTCGPTYQMVHFMIAGGALLEIVLWT
jgi:hypothetical protein